MPRPRHDPHLRPIVYLGCPAAERAGAERSLAAAALSVVWADTLAYALTELQRRDMPVLVDLSRGAAAVQHARELRAQRASALTFAVVDGRRPELTTEAVLAGVADVFARPLGGRRVAHAIERELGQHAAATRMPAVPEPLYCHSAAMQDVHALVVRAAAMRAGVVIQGEEGTGRQVVARAIHAAQTPSEPFLVVDCGACDLDGLERELFGCGAATGSVERVSRKSRLYDARGGTMYLQNIAEAPARVQGRLARVLRDREAALAETGETVSLDVRPIAGADPGIDRVVHEGRVREDLFRRLSVLRIEMPALRSRHEDLPALANYLTRQLCARRGMPAKTLSRAALSLIAALPWRGNAIELRTLLEGAIGGARESRAIGIEDLLRHVRLDGGSVVFANGGTLRQARARFEREYITAILEQHHGRISEAARALGIQRTNLYRKMRSLRVNQQRRHKSP